MLRLAQGIYFDLALLLLRFNRLILFFFHCRESTAGQRMDQSHLSWAHPKLMQSADTRQGYRQRRSSSLGFAPWHAWSLLLESSWELSDKLEAAKNKDTPCGMHSPDIFSTPSDE